MGLWWFGLSPTLTVFAIVFWHLVTQQVVAKSADLRRHAWKPIVIIVSTACGYQLDHVRHGILKIQVFHGVDCDTEFIKLVSTCYLPDSPWYQRRRHSSCNYSKKPKKICTSSDSRIVDQNVECGWMWLYKMYIYMYINIYVYIYICIHIYIYISMYFICIHSQYSSILNILSKDWGVSCLPWERELAARFGGLAAQHRVSESV